MDGARSLLVQQRIIIEEIGSRRRLAGMEKKKEERKVKGQPPFPSVRLTLRLLAVE